MGTAYLKLLKPRNSSVVVDLDYIIESLKKLDFEDVKLASNYDPSFSNGQLVIWRFKEEDKLSDLELAEIVGNKGNALYAWECECCKRINSRRTYVNI